MKSKWNLVFAVGLALSLMTGVAVAQEATMTKEVSVIEDGKTVKFDYTLTVEGQVVESSDGREPLEYSHGAGQIIPGLANELAGLKAGDTKKVNIAPADAYGEVLKEGFREVPKSQFPEGFEFQQGLVVEMQTPDGQAIPAVVWEIKEEAVVLNFNHPLAGKSLEFDVTIVSVE